MKEHEKTELLINAPQLSFPTSEEMNQLMPNDLNQDDDRIAHEYFQHQEEQQWYYSQQNSL